MSEEASQVEQYHKTNSRLRRRGTLVFLIVVIIAAAVVLPPFVNVSRYQRQITALMSRSLNRPVRLSSVNLRLLPRPGFVLNNLTVGEAPEFGVEPILSAETVVASIRLSALLTGKVEIDRIRLEDASLNLVQTSPGRWNIDEVMTGGLVQGMSQTAPTAVQPVFRHQPAAFPFVEAKNSRVNIKHGLEKLPYSLTETQLSFWQESPGIWRLRLRGEPARTDMELSAGDTGELRLEATLQTLPNRSLYQMPLKVQAEWREAQLGQLSRLLIGSDQGWRGDLTADLALQGTLDSAQTEARFRATGVRREEFIPASLLDFDIHCGLLYQHTQRAVHNLDCTTAIEEGKLELKAELPGESAQPEAALTVDNLPLQAGLDILRTVRNGFAPGIAADGKISGSLHLGAPAVPAPGEVAKSAKTAAHASAQHTSTIDRQPSPTQNASQAQSAFQGEIAIVNGTLRGGALTHPLTLPQITLTAAQIPGAISSGSAGNTPISALSTHFSLPLTARTPQQPPSAAKAAATPVAHDQNLAIRLQFTEAGYQFGVNGSGQSENLREIAYSLGVKRSPAIDSIAGGQVDVDSIATGPWLQGTAEPASSDTPVLSPSAASLFAPSSTQSNSAQPAAETKPASTSSQSASSRPTSAKSGSSKSSSSKSGQSAPPMPLPGSSDALAGGIHLHRISWSAPYLARAADFSDATITFAGDTASASGSFTYGALSGTASVAGIGVCAQSACNPQIEIHLGSNASNGSNGSGAAPLDAATIEGALLGAPETKSLLSPLIDRVRNSQRALWPEAAVKVSADSLILGPVTLHKPVLAMKLKGKDLTLESWQADLLGGQAKGTGSSTWNGNQLAYTLEGSFTNLSGTQLGQLLEHPGPSARSAAATADKSDDNQNRQASVASSTASLWSGGPVDGSGKVEMSGLTAKELAASANGTLHFHWLKGTVPVTVSPAPSAPQIAPQPGAHPAAPSVKLPVTAAHFASWTGDSTLGSGAITLGANTFTAAAQEKAPGAATLTGSIPFGGPAHLARVAKAPSTQADTKPNTKTGAKTSANTAATPQAKP